MAKSQKDWSGTSEDDVWGPGFLVVVIEVGQTWTLLQLLVVSTEHVVALMPEVGSPQHARVLQYRELLDALPMDAYTHGCILHPELTTDSMIPKYATAEIRSECCPAEPSIHPPSGRSSLLTSCFHSWGLSIHLSPPSLSPFCLSSLCIPSPALPPHSDNCTDAYPPVALLLGM